MKYSAAMLKGYALIGVDRKAIGKLQDDTGAVCAIGAVNVGFGRSPFDVGAFLNQRPLEAFRKAYGIPIATANNGYGERHLDENGQPGLSIPTIAGMLKAIGQ